MPDPIEIKYLDLPMQSTERVIEPRQPQEPRDRKELLRQPKKQNQQSDDESSSEEKRKEDTFEREEMLEENEEAKPLMVQKSKSLGKNEEPGSVIDITI